MGKIDNNLSKQTITIHSEYITLGQFLKFVNIISEGGRAKIYLSTHKVFVNGEEENRRGRKLRQSDVITLNEGTFFIEQK